MIMRLSRLDLRAQQSCTPSSTFFFSLYFFSFFMVYFKLFLLFFFFFSFFSFCIFFLCFFFCFFAKYKKSGASESRGGGAWLSAGVFRVISWCPSGRWRTEDAAQQKVDAVAKPDNLARKQGGRPLSRWRCRPPRAVYFQTTRLEYDRRHGTEGTNMTENVSPQGTPITFRAITNRRRRSHAGNPGWIVGASPRAICSTGKWTQRDLPRPTHWWPERTLVRGSLLGRNMLFILTDDLRLCWGCPSWCPRWRAKQRAMAAADADLPPPDWRIDRLSTASPWHNQRWQRQWPWSGAMQPGGPLATCGIFNLWYGGPALPTATWCVILFWLRPGSLWDARQSAGTRPGGNGNATAARAAEQAALLQKGGKRPRMG